MDGCDVESRHWVLEDKSWLQILLHRTARQQIARDGTEQLSERLPTNATATYARASPALAQATSGVRQQYERPIPRGGSDRIHTPGIRCHAPRKLASVPDFDKTFRAAVTHG